MNETGDVALPVDLVTISHTVEHALARRLALPERSWVDATTRQLLGQLSLLLLEDLGDTDSAPVRDLHRAAYRLLDRHGRPDAETPPLHAYEYLRTLATVTRAIAALYDLRRGGGSGTGSAEGGEAGGPGSNPSGIQ